MKVVNADQQQLDAGGLVLAKAKLGKAEVVETVVARAYQHAGLPGRVVVRLVAQNVIAGDDLEMTTLGFGAGEDRGAVAKERTRPLGFPGWALVHDPKHARYALDVVKEFKKHARKAKSKPGHAKDGFDAIAETLGKTVPHFLPSFFEEAGRTFIEHGAPSQAATMFGKAREAEAVHALDVDEQHRVDGFLEFALAGAVTTKALTQYAKELGEHHQPAVAYAHFRQLCLQRTLGGMPPWSGMAKELRRLAKAAKLDIDAEDRGFVVEIIESPALGKAAGEFWRAYADPITELGKQSPAARGALLNLFPTGTGNAKDLDEAWLDLLEATGAVEALVSNAAPAEVRPGGGRAAWFDKLTVHLARDYRDSRIGDRAFALLRRMAPMLIADGKPIAATGRYRQIDLDLCELALELGIPVAPPAQYPRLELRTWAQHAHEPGHGCDPVLTAVHPTMGPLLAVAVAQAIGGGAFDAVSRGKPGFLAAKRAWLEALIARAEQGGLVDLGEVIAIVEDKVNAETFSDLPDLHVRFGALDPAPALARSLRTGLVDELGWPALEAAGVELDPDGKAGLTVHGGPPAVVLATQTRAIAIGTTGRLATHDLVIPPKHELGAIRFVGGEFLVILKQGYQVRAYWSSAPHDLFDSEVSAWSIAPLAPVAAVLADGAWIEGAKPLRAGDRRIPETHNLAACDGTISWVTEWKDSQMRWREVSASGELGRYSWPTFIEAGIEPEWKVDSSASYLMPLPGITSSPLGVRDGMVGMRVRYQGDTQRAAAKRDVESIDGTRWGGAGVPTCFVRLPGSDEPRPVVEEVVHRKGVTATLLDPAGLVRGCHFGAAHLQYGLGQVASLPPKFWHHFTPRDVPGSVRLRAITDQDARALIAALPNAGATVLPEITNARLRAGVLGFAMVAAKQQLDRDRLHAERAPEMAGAQGGPTGEPDALLLEGLGGWGERQWSHGEGNAWGQLEATAGMFAANDRSDRYLHDLPASALDWLGFAVSRSALAFIATAIGTPVAARKSVAALYAAISRLLPRAEQLRVYDATGTLALPGEGTGFRIRWWNGNAYATRKPHWGETLRVLEYAPGGVFHPLPGLALAHEVRGVPDAGGVDLDAVVAAVAAGRTSWSTAAGNRLAEVTGLTPSEATFLWAGAPNANDRSANFLAKELREALGLKAIQAATARDGLATIPLAKRLAAIDEAGRGGVAALLEGSAVEALAAAWLRIVGKKIAVPEDLITDADRMLKTPLEPSQALAMIGAAHEVPELNVDGIWALDKGGDVIRASRPEPVIGQEKIQAEAAVFTAKVMETLAAYLPFLYAELPVGHHLRAQAPVAYERALARLANPALWFDGGHMWWEPTKQQEMERFLDALGGNRVDGIEGAHAVSITGAIISTKGSRAALRIHPATLDAKSSPAVASVATRITYNGAALWSALEYIRSPRLAALMARITKTPVPAGSWEQHPGVSAPKLVEQAATKLGVSRDAATLYLQYLTLLWPTAKNVQEWNGWKPKQLEAATAELLAADLILEAKRERAQRGYFLPGGWEALKTPHPPMESWKVALYGTRSVDGDPIPPLGRFLALVPFHQLFDEAWQRITSGDIPRYEEVKR